MSKLIGSGGRCVKTKTRVLLSLTLPFTLVLNFTLLFLLFTLAPTQAGSSTGEPTLSCEQIGDVGLWSKKRYGGAKDVDMRSKKYAQKVGSVFLEKLDPYRIIFKQGEAEAFRQGATTAWLKVLNDSRCDYFDSWVTLQYLRAKAELDRRFLTVPLDFKVGSKIDDSVTSSLKSSRPKSFAKDESELRKRLAKFSKKIGSAISPKVLAAYQNDKRRFLVETANQILFEEPVVAHTLLAKAMLGAMDPYSTYFPPSEFEDFYHELAGGTSGVGLKVRKVPQGLMVEKVMKDSPAGRSKKIAAGDVITGIDDQNVTGISVKAAKNLLKGKENTAVKLTVRYDLEGKKTETFIVDRENFTFEDGKITLRMMTPKNRPTEKVAVIEIPSFYGRGGMDPMNEERSSAEDLEKVVRGLVSGKNKPSAIVLDLRGNPGGFLEEAVSMAGLFIGNKPVVGVVEHHDRRVLRDHRRAIYDGPLMVLLDDGSASASEVLAGALKDHQRAVLVGTKSSYGKGSVQRLFHLADELAPSDGKTKKAAPGVVKVTTSIFYSPLGHSPANGGIRPHLVLPTELTDEDADSENEKAVVSTVPESAPFLDSSGIRQIRKDETILHAQLVELEEKNLPKLTQMIELPEKLDGVADQNLTKVGEKVARGAAVLAAAYAAMEQKSAPSAVVKPHSALRNARRDVIGY